jgi:putative membrane protein
MGKGKKFGFILSTAMLCTALSAVTALAQSTNSNTSSMGREGGMMMLSSADRKFAMMAAMGGMAEVEMARVALTKASSDAVKQYAQKMIDDHTTANAELMQIASAKGITLPAAPDAKHRAMMAKMERLSGAEFDRQYISMAGHKDHQKMEKLFRDESMRGRDADLKAFAAKTLPVVRQHLQMARDLHAGMSGMKGMKHDK